MNENLPLLDKEKLEILALNLARVLASDSAHIPAIKSIVLPIIYEAYLIGLNK